MFRCCIVCIGGSPNSSRESVTLQKKYGDNASLDIVGQQTELLRKVLETGRAIADVIFGDVNPGAKLPVTIARSAEHLPAYYSQKSTGFLKDYLFEKEDPLFCFGFGLSYTTFEYKQLELSKETINMNESVEVSVYVKNIGNRVGDEIVQMYIKDKAASV